MSWLLMGICVILTVELFLYLRVAKHATVSGGVAHKASRTFMSPSISDHWKEKAIGAYALKLFLGSLQLGGRLILAFLPFIVVALLPFPIARELGYLTVSPVGIICCTLIGILYVKIRTSLRRG